MAGVITAAGPASRYYSVSGGGGFVDGQAITINGSGFGTLAGSSRQTLKDTVDASVNGTAVPSMTGLAAAGWVTSDGLENSLGMHHQSSTTSPLFGSKCILAQAINGEGRFGIGWNTGSTYTKVYTRDYVNITCGGNPAGQWKNIRYTANDCLTDDDTMNNYWTVTFNGFAFDALQCNQGNGCGLAGTTSVDTKSQETNVVFNVWYERETELVFGSQGVADGIAQRRFRRVSDWVEITNESWTNVINYGAANTNRPRFIHYQDYQGNGLDGATPTGVKIDALFAQVGSRRRAYISPQSTWASVLSTGPRELLDRITSWSATQITGTLRQGILTSGQMSGPLYGYVIDDNGGNVNTSGIAIV